MPDNQLQEYFKQIVLPKADSHKGQNGRVLVIGGSKLFHAAPCWAATMASKVVDLVHFTSPALENNELMRVRAKEQFWDGIVVPWEEVEKYIEEDDAVLIGPGMPRDEGLMPGEKRTKEIAERLLTKYPGKRWVVDGGALQETSQAIFNENMILTPNLRELEILYHKTGTKDIKILTRAVNEATILAKGMTDIVCNKTEYIEIHGGNAGMTKGGTGDILAGLVAALYAKSPTMSSAVTASKAAKMAGESAARRVGLFLNADDLIPEIQISLHAILTGRS